MTTLHDFVNIEEKDTKQDDETKSEEVKTHQNVIYSKMKLLLSLLTNAFIFLMPYLSISPYSLPRCSTGFKSC